MPQSGYTPIQIYSSSTPTNAPSAGNLTNDTKGSELAINIADGKLFYKDTSNVVKVLADASWSGTVTSVGATAPIASSGGNTPTISISQATTSTNGYLSSTDWNTFNGKQAALVSGTNIKTVNGTTLLGSGDLGTITTAYGGTGLSSWTAGDLPYYASGTALSKLAIGASTTILTSTGSAPQWSAASGVTVGTATNANNINVSDDNSTIATYYPVWVTGTGNKVSYISSTQLTWNPGFAQLFNPNGSLKPYGINAYGGITGGTTVGATNFMGSVNGNVAPCLEVRQQRADKDNLVLTTNQNLDAYLFRVQENTTDRFVIRGTTAGFGVGIGTATPAYQLELSADSAAKPTTNTWTIASDRRVKTVLREFTKGLDAICGLRPIVYKYNGLAGFQDLESENVSIIADEAREYLPEDVGTFKAKLRPEDSEDTELLNWKGHAVTFALINAIKELKQQLDEVKQQLGTRQ